VERFVAQLRTFISEEIMTRLLWLASLLYFRAQGPAFAAADDLLQLVQSIPLPAVSGRIDHIDLDASNGRLFIAALGNNTLEAVDLKQNRHARSVAGFGEPQGVVYITELGRLFVASGSGNRVDILDGTSLASIKRMEGLEDADNVRYDAKAGLVYVGYGAGALRVLDARTGDSLGDIRLAGHPESFQLEKSGKRIFVNVPAAGHIAVVDRAARKVVATWTLQGVAANFPMALDERGHRLYVATRKPAALLVYSTETGSLVDRIRIGEDADDLFFEPSTKRIYVICGEGLVNVIGQTDSIHHALLGTTRTAPGARTALFDLESRQLFLAVPARGGSRAEIRIYRTR
jgi:DNA-binding beta-propeller fold protein YncE